jgi:hypothetical protein
VKKLAELILYRNSSYVLSILPKLRNVITLHGEKCLYYIHIFMSKILCVPMQDIPTEAVQKFMDYVKSPEIPDPRMSLKEVILIALGFELNLIGNSENFTHQRMRRSESMPNLMNGKRENFNIIGNFRQLAATFFLSSFNKAIYMNF